MATENGICREVVYIDGAEFVFKDSPESETAKQILTRLFNKSGLGLYKAVEKAKDAHPGMTSAQNISNKFKRNTIDLLEMIYLAEACGYTISFNQIGDKAESDSSPIMAIDDSPRASKEKKEPITKTESFQYVFSINFIGVSFDGENSKKASKNYTALTFAEMSKNDGEIERNRELEIIKRIEQKYNVKADFIIDPESLEMGE